MKTLTDVRETFLDYFEKQCGHTRVASAPVVPQNDPTLMFNAAGMVPFKDVFTGKEKRDYVRAVSSQKCIRAGGKHNDLENVGYTARHHTFFEMLGNFSFGDYFKDEAIPFAWQLLTKEFMLPADKLYITIYHNDEEAAKIWQKVTGFSDDRIIRIATDDNFWSMGDTGPCGPSTEIFYDHGEGVEGGLPGTPEEDGDRYIEIWNIVFMQYEKHADGTRTDLPNPSIDTGMGLERMTAVLQGKHNNFEVDLFQNIINGIADSVGRRQQGDDLMSMRVIADHLRATSFMMADGVLPSNEGRGYVLRRIMRRAMRHAHLLGAQEPLMHQLVPSLIAKMGQAYPELTRAQNIITDTLSREENRFRDLLENGLKLLDKETATLSKGDTLNGEVAFKLYDTFGFPLDLTQDVLKKQHITVDEAGFNAAMAKQKAQGRESWSGSGDASNDKLWFDVADKVGATDFVGYDGLMAQSDIVALVKDNAQTDRLSEGQVGWIMTNKTPFYATSGGQVGDQGVITSKEGAEFRVEKTEKMASGVFAHFGQVISGNLSVSDTVDLTVDHDRRKAIECHHSVTHLLHEALRRELGDHVAQKGSLQNEERTRFDISHPDPIIKDQLVAIERAVNHYIRQNTLVETKTMSIDDAMESGARALFGEKYDDTVRVVSMGRDDGIDKSYSIELCGGTHVTRTGDIGVFKIISESGVSAGVRRIEAVAGAKALNYIDQTIEALHSDVAKAMSEKKNQEKTLQKDIADLRKQLATGGTGNNDTEDVNGVKFVGKVMDDIPPKDLKPMADALKEKLGSGVVVLISGVDGKASIVVGVTPDLTDKINAVDLVRAGSQALGGKGGGGRPDMAQAGGSQPENGQTALETIKQKIA